MTEDADERALVEAAQRDPAQFGALYERHFERVYAFVLGRVRDRDAAEDLTADVFHNALASLPRFEWRGAPFGAWLIRIAANAVTNHRVRAARFVAAAPETFEAPDAPEAPELFEDLARLFRFVDALPPDQRAVIVERFAHERSIREVAARLGRTEGAVKQLQHRAVQTLRARMEAGRG